MNKQSYEQKKEALLKEFKNKKGKGIISINKNTSNLFRSRQKIKKQRINVRNFSEVISIDKENLTAEVEGMTTFETLVNETLKYNLLPPVVPQLKMITLGGAISGIGIEASSFKYGLVHETVLEMEVLLGNGKIITCTPKNKYKDLFFNLPNSYGTLGYILKVKIKLIKARKFVEINHLKYNNQKEYFKDISNLCKKDYDFIDGTVFNENEMYITLGKFIDSAPYAGNYKYMNIYYKSIRKNKVDYLTTKDFIWRWDPDWFWTSRLFLMQNFIPRLLFGKFMLNSNAYIAIRRLNDKYNLTQKFSLIKNFFKKTKKSEAVVQDVGIPIENCVQFFDFFNKEIKIKPFWICPTKSYNKNTFPLFDIDTEKLYIDFGFWDFVQSDKPTGYYNKKIELIVEKLKGKKSLYSESFYREKEFWRIYNGNIYKKLKAKYDPNHVFLNLYEKCVKRA